LRPGGRLVYVTCSLLAEENAGSIEGFLGEHGDGEFACLPADAVAGARLPGVALASATAGPGLTLTPHRHGTDGFYVAVLERRQL
jgi:16S rRNA (cytosine967-C5)-methyltransferase